MYYFDVIRVGDCRERKGYNKGKIIPQTIKRTVSFLLHHLINMVIISWHFHDDEH